MTFQFSLDPLLRFRQSVEHQHELRLRAANQQVARVRHLIEQVDQALLQAQLLRSRHLLAGAAAAELRFELDSEEALQAKRKGIEGELSRLSKLRDQQLEVFQHARRNREITESLRNQQFREYVRNAKRAEQRRLDDLFLLRRSYLRRG